MGLTGRREGGVGGSSAWRMNTMKMRLHQRHVSGQLLCCYPSLLSLHLSLSLSVSSPLTFLSSPLSHFLYLSSNYPCAVSSNRSLNDTGLHWQVLSSRATIGKKDLRKDKIGPTNSDNSKHIMAWRTSDAVLHRHLVAGSPAGAPSEDAGHQLQAVSLQRRDPKISFEEVFHRCAVRSAMKGLRS